MSDAQIVHDTGTVQPEQENDVTAAPALQPRVSRMAIGVFIVCLLLPAICGGLYLSTSGLSPKEDYGRYADQLITAANIAHHHLQVLHVFAALSLLAAYLGFISIIRIVFFCRRLRGVAWAILGTIISLLYLFAPCRFAELYSQGAHSDVYVKVIQNAVEAFACDTGYYPAHLADLTQSDPTSVNGVCPNGSGQGGVHGMPLATKPIFHGPYLKAIPDNPDTNGHAEGTDYRYNNQTGTVGPGQKH